MFAHALGLKALEGLFGLYSYGWPLHQVHSRQFPLLCNCMALLNTPHLLTSNCNHVARTAGQGFYRCHAPGHLAWHTAHAWAAATWPTRTWDAVATDDHTCLVPHSVPRCCLLRARLPSYDTTWRGEHNNHTHTFSSCSGWEVLPRTPQCGTPPNNPAFFCHIAPLRYRAPAWTMPDIHDCWMCRAFNQIC